MDKLSITLFDRKYDRSGFDCTNASLNAYLQKQVSQDVKKRLAVCFILVNEADQIKGFYTLSNSSIPQEDVPERFAKKFPIAYKHIPVTLLGRLAVDKSILGKGKGAYLLLDALREAYEVSKKSIGSVAIIVDPIDEGAVHFYQKYGFSILADSKKMFLPMQVVAQLFS